MQDHVLDVLVPTCKETVIRRGKKKEEERKLFPGYVLVKMLMTDPSWHAVRNAPNSTGIVGSGNIPIPISNKEFENIQKLIGNNESKIKTDLKIGDLVTINEGPFRNHDATVSEVNLEKQKIKVCVNVFNRKTPVELDFSQVTKK